MTEPTGTIIETPTEELPFKAVISSQGEGLREKFFTTRPEAEAFVVETLRSLGEHARRPSPK